MAKVQLEVYERGGVWAIARGREVLAEFLTHQAAVLRACTLVAELSGRALPDDGRYPLRVALSADTLKYWLACEPDPRTQELLARFCSVLELQSSDEAREAMDSALGCRDAYGHQWRRAMDGVVAKIDAAVRGGAVAA